MYQFLRSALLQPSSLLLKFLLLAVALQACCTIAFAKGGHGAPWRGSHSQDTQTADDALLPEFDPLWTDTGAFSNSASCGACHSAADDRSGTMRFPASAEGNDISPYAGWQHSVMAHAFNDPYYRAQVEAEVARFPSLAGTIEDKCLTCHTPMAHTHAHSTGMLANDACLSDQGCYRMESAEADMMAREAIGCTLCHQTTDGEQGDAISGEFTIDEEQLTIFGPYTDVRTRPMAMNTQYEVAGAEYIRQSAHCANCHDLDTPSVDVNTNQLTGREFPEQAPFREWRNSAFNSGSEQDQQCQDCHMPEIPDYRTKIATTPSGRSVRGWPVRDEYSQHFFLGGNTYLLELLRDYREELGIANTTTEVGFEGEIVRNTQFMSEQAAELSIDAMDIRNGQLSIDVAILNKSGHKLPTSFPSRRVWLNLLVRDAAGRLLFESGTPDAKGFLTTDAAHAGPECVSVEKGQDYEPGACYSSHHDVITSPDQIPVYEAVMGDTNRHPTYVLLYGDTYLKDNRIPPAGFSASGEHYSEATAISGLATSDPDFNREDGREGTGRDIVHYELDWSGLARAGLQVEATLYYQSIRPAFVNGMQHDGPQVDQFRAMYEQNKPEPLVLDRITIMYP